MKHSHSSTSAQEAEVQELLGAWGRIVQQWQARLAPHFARPQPHRHASRYLEAVLSDIPRKNGWQIAEQARELRPYGMQRLLSQAVWDHDGVRDDLRTQLCHVLTAPAAEPSTERARFPIVVLDESGFPKRGSHSAGVGQQYCGVHGRVENCQVGVFLGYVTARGHGLIDRELYLQEDWCEDLPRREAAHIPDAVSFRTKPELSQLMLQRVQAAGLPIQWVVADTVYGHSTNLRLFLEEQSLAYALAVPSTEVVCVQTPDGERLSDVGRIGQRLQQRDWQPLSQSMGSKGERGFDWAWLPVLHQGRVDGRHFLLLRRSLDDRAKLSSYLVWAPADTPLSTIVQTIGARWHIEEDLQTAKKLGLDHYETRSYLGWYRHITLVLVAAALLVELSLHPPSPEAAVPLIALTCSEVRHLLAHLLFPPPTSLSFTWRWSLFRRKHQYWAGCSHRRRRANAG